MQASKGCPRYLHEVLSVTGTAHRDATAAVHTSVSPIMALDLRDRRDVASAKGSHSAGQHNKENGEDQQHTAAGHPEPRHAF